MINYKHIATALFATSLLAGNAAFGADASYNAFYMGGSLGQARPNFDTTGTTNVGTGVQSSDGAWKVFTGYQFHRYFSVEGTYINLGSYRANNGNTIEPVGWGIALVGELPIGNNFSLLGRLGEYKMRQRMNPSGVSDNSWSPTFGAGLRYDFNANISARAEYERIQKIGTSTNTVSTDANVYTLGLGYRF